MKVILYKASLLWLLGFNFAMAEPTSPPIGTTIIVGSDDKTITVTQERANGVTLAKFTPSGFQVNEVQTIETDGFILRGHVGDLNDNEYPEFYFISSSSGSGGYQDLIVFEEQPTQRLRKLNFEKLPSNHKASEGYMGGDKFTFSESYIEHEFPLYNFTDANCCPTGGKRVVRYKLNNSGNSDFKFDSFWGHKVSDSGPKDPEAFIEALEYIQKMKDKAAEK